MRINLPVFEKDNCYMFSLGRNAMYAAFLSAGLKAGDKVLTPAYDCDGALQPFKALGLEPVFFRSDARTFKVDLEDIKRKISPGVKMLHVINHFGFPQPWEEILALRERTGVPILEDNAYSLFSAYKGKPFGSFGDFSVFSLRKNLPLIGGGMLRVNNSTYSVNLTKRAAPLFYRTERANFLTFIKRSLGYYKAPEALRDILRRSSASVEPPPLYSEEGKGYPYWPSRDKIGEEFSCDYLRPISLLSAYELGRFSSGYFSLIKENKLRHYVLLARRLSSVKGVEVLWPVLPEGAVPFCLCLLIGSERDKVFEALRKRYDIMSWPTLPQAVIDDLKDFPEVGLLGRKLLQINLASDRVTEGSFERYLERLVGDLATLTS